MAQGLGAVERALYPIAASNENMLAVAKTHPWFPGQTFPATGRPRVICFPYAGGSCLSFTRLRATAGDLDLLTAELPGHIARPGERLHTEFHALADEVTAAIGDALDGPFVLFGY